MPRRLGCSDTYISACDVLIKRGKTDTGGNGSEVCGETEKEENSEL
jgi:hypothetical protein